MNNITVDTINAAKELIKKYNNPSLSLVQVRLKLTYEEANLVMQELSKTGFLSNYTNSCNIFQDKYTSKQIVDCEALTNSFNFDELEGHDFEYFCADILKYNGFSSIQVTSGSGDFGIDILCYKGAISYAIQCKCYSGNVGNHAVQEAVSGKLYYKYDKAVVMTNSKFTHAAEETARLTDADLWDRTIVTQFYKVALANGYVPKYQKMR